MSPATNGRMDAHLAAITWPWRAGAERTRAIEHRVPKDFAPRWYCMVPEGMERPDWIPGRALVFPLGYSQDVGYVW